MTKQQRDRIYQLITARDIALQAKWNKANPKPATPPTSSSAMLAIGLLNPNFVKELQTKLRSNPEVINCWDGYRRLDKLLSKHCSSYRATKEAHAKWIRALNATAESRGTKFQKLKDRILFDGLDLAKIMAEIQAVD